MDIQNIPPQSQQPEPPTPQINSSFFLPLIIIGLIILYVGIMGGLYLAKRQTASQLVTNPNPTVFSSLTPTFVPTVAPDETANWKTYTNNELGISFKYPKSFGEFELSFANGETGKVFIGGFKKGYFAIGGITEDYTVGRSGNFFDFVKYLNESGKYYHLMALGKKFWVEPVKIIDINGQEALIVNGDSYVEERGIEGPTINPGVNGGALINLINNDEFKGMAVINLDLETISQEKFEQILSTFKFLNQSQEGNEVIPDCIPIGQYPDENQKCCQIEIHDQNGKRFCVGGV